MSSKASLYIASQLYKKLVAVSGYRQLQATDVKFVYGLLFKLLKDVAYIVDTASIHLEKTRSDQVVIDTYTRVALQKAASEIVTLVELFGMQVTKPFIDEYAVTDYVLMELLKTYNETVSLTEELTKNVSKTVVEPVVLSENIVTSVDYVRKFTDTLSLIDSITADRYRSLDEQELATISDTLVLNSIKHIDENIITEDSLSWVTGKNIDELLFVGDSITFSTNLKFSEVLTVLESFNYYKSLSADAIDSVGTVDTLVLSTGVKPNDTVWADDSVFYDVGKSFIDSAGISSYNRIHVLTKHSESVLLYDNVIVTLVKPDSSMFNASPFNQSTFG